MSRLAVFSGPMGGDPDALRPASTGLAPCVWEAAVLAQEREAFVRHVLCGDGPLESRLQAWGSDALRVPRLIAWELGTDGHYRQVADVTGDNRFDATLPYPVTVTPADLVRG